MARVSKGNEYTKYDRIQRIDNCVVLFNPISRSGASCSERVLVPIPEFLIQITHETERNSQN